MERIVLHCDCNAFFASVEELVNPQYKNLPMAVGGDPKSRRGIILAKNQLAKQYNIQTAENLWKALQKCPQLVIVPPRHDLYGKYCSMINKIYQDYSDLVQPTSIDESYIDVTGSYKLFASSGEELAHIIRKRVEKEIGITISVGVSFNKIFAKLGSDYKKPNAVTCITRDNYREVLWTLPVDRMYMAGKSTCETLRKLHIYTIEDLAKSSEKLLETHLGKAGTMLYNYANGNDSSPVLSSQDSEQISTVGNGLTFKRDLVSLKDIQTAVKSLSGKVAERLRRKNLKCSTVQVNIKNPQLKVITRQSPLDTPTWLSSEISCMAVEIIRNSWEIGKPIRMLTITATNLISSEDASQQLNFFMEDNSERIKERESLEQALDKIRERYGSQSIKLGSIIDNDLGIYDKSEPLEKQKE